MGVNLCNRPTYIDPININYYVQTISEGVEPGVHCNRARVPCKNSYS